MSKTLFNKGTIVRSNPPSKLANEYLLDQMKIYGVEETVYCGGNAKTEGDAYLFMHNWHKKSIFWTLPYWKDLLLRHNLDVMHIEKNFFNNMMHTLFNVQSKTKDNLKSRLDLPLLCCRPELHLTEDGKAPIPIYRLSREVIFFC